MFSLFLGLGRCGRAGRAALVAALLVVAGGGMLPRATAAGADGGSAAAYEPVGFDRLAGFAFVPPVPDPAQPAAAPAGGEEQIPAEIKALDGRKAMITGYMLPVRLVQGRVTEFLLVKDPSMCCFGAVPNMNEWVVVKMKDGGVKPVMDVPVSFYGELKVGAMFENGYMTGIYSLAGERMAETSGS